MASLITGIASSLVKIYTALHDQYKQDDALAANDGFFKRLITPRSESLELGKKIFRPFDETVEFAESAKTTWDNALYKSSAERVLAIIGVRDDLDKSKEKMESLKKVLEKKKAKNAPEMVAEGLQSTSLYLSWCDAFKSDLTCACKNAKDAATLRGLSDKCSNYAREIRQRQDIFRPSFK